MVRSPRFQVLRAVTYDQISGSKLKTELVLAAQRLVERHGMKQLCPSFIIMLGIMIFKCVYLDVR